MLTKESQKWKEAKVLPSVYVYFTTDVNRTRIEVAFTESLLILAKNINNTSLSRFNLPGAKQRVVYYEKYAQIESASQRVRELSFMTKTQKEKLIRRQNANWTDLSQRIMMEAGIGLEQKNPALRPGFNYN